MNKRTQLIMIMAIVFFIATAFITWFLLGETPAPTEPPAPTPTEPPAPTGPCKGSVYRMIYEYNPKGECVPNRCESGYTNIAEQCIYDGSDTNNLVMVNNTNYTRIGRAGWRLGKIRL